MFGLDERIAALSDGASIWIVLAVAVLLGLRHATDPDHLAAVTTLAASAGERVARRAGELGLAWGLGHAVTLFASGLPILLLDSVLPLRVQQAAETAIGLVIVYLALRLD
jgi:high-affinity nickel permease